MRKLIYILLVAILLITPSCRKESIPDIVASEGYGAIELTLSSQNAIRLKTKSDEDELLEGLRFENVLVILTDNADNVVGKVYKEYPYSPLSGDIQTEVTAQNITQDVIYFDHLLPGNYHAFVYANINHTDWQQGGSGNISSQELLVQIGDSFSSYFEHELLNLTTAGSDVPADPSNSMLLTGRLDISVGLTVISKTIDLLRPVVHFKVSVRNHTQFPVSVDELRFSPFNPDKAYLLDHRDASGVPSVPFGVTYREMPTFGTSAEDDASVDANTEEVIYQRLMYENAYPGTYKVYATLTLDRSPSLDPIQLRLGDLPFGVIDFTILNEMNDGEQVDVLVTNPQISPRSGRIFAYISRNNYMAWESAGYSNYDNFYTRALAIYNKGAYDYSEHYTDPAQHGYSSWDGVSPDASEVPTFNYEDKGSLYFHTLSKSGGLFTLEGLAINNSTKGVVSGSSISGIRFEEGQVVPDKNPPDVGGKLVRFINSSNNKYIQANTNWNKDQARQQQSNLMWQDSGTNQDRQFMLFGKYLCGGKMKRILKENNKEVPLTYMARNEEINLVINVYYADQEGTLNFEVYNSDWITSTESSHTFN